VGLLREQLAESHPCVDKDFLSKDVRAAFVFRRPRR
jgi:hypothetical protein